MEYTHKTITASVTLAALHTAAGDAEQLASCKRGEEMGIMGGATFSDQTRRDLAVSLAKAYALMTLLAKRRPELDPGVWRDTVGELLVPVLLDETTPERLDMVAAQMRALADHITTAAKPVPKSLDLTPPAAGDDE